MARRNYPKVRVCSACGGRWTGPSCAYCGSSQSIQTTVATARALTREYERRVFAMKQYRPDCETLERRINELYP